MVGDRFHDIEGARLNGIASVGVLYGFGSRKELENAEDRAKFSQMLTNNGINQPEWSALTSMEDIDNFIERVGFPVLVRPSYVLSGAAMNVCSNEDELKRFLQLAANVSEDHPVVVSKFIEHAK